MRWKIKLKGASQMHELNDSVFDSGAHLRGYLIHTFELIASWFRAASALAAISDCLCSFSLSTSTSRARLPVTVSEVSCSLGAHKEYEDMAGAVGVEEADAATVAALVPRLRADVALVE
jgi:hypothetical protein